MERPIIEQPLCQVAPWYFQLLVVKLKHDFWPLENLTTKLSVFKVFTEIPHTSGRA